MNSYFRQITNFLYRLGNILLIYSAARLFFFVVNYQTYAFNSLWEILRIFVFGIRFDFTTVIMVNLWFLLLYLIPFNIANNKIYIRIVGYLFYAYNFFLLLFNFSDAAYFKFIGKRSTADIFNYIFLSGDVARLLPRFFADFWYIGLVCVVCFAGAILIEKRIRRINPGIHHFNGKQWFAAISLFLLVNGTLFITARGTGLKPVRIISAASYTASQNIPLLLNTPFCILMTIGNEVLKPIVYFDNKMLDNLYIPEHQYSNSNKKRDNVIVVVLESFSKEFVGALNNGHGYTPFLDKIIAQSLVFDNAFANGKRSIEAIPAVLAGLPALSDDSYISSRYSANQLRALPLLLSEEGYQTSFFHGGHNGTMGFDEFTKICGIKEYYGFNEYKGPKADDGNWGINDENFLQYYASQLNKFKEPFFSAVFTLSSHHPFTLPSAYKDSFTDAPNDLLKTIRYADKSLSLFFNTIAKMPWYKHTLFVIMADHTTMPQSELYETVHGMYRIPLIYFHPGDSALHGIDHRVTQQTDVMPSVIDYLGIQKPFLAFGNSIFNKSSHTWAVNFLGGTYHFFDQQYLLSFDGEKSISLYNYQDDIYLKNNIIKDNPNHTLTMEKHLKAIIQQDNHRLLTNKLIPESIKPAE